MLARQRRMACLQIAGIAVLTIMICFFFVPAHAANDAAPQSGAEPTGPAQPVATHAPITAVYVGNDPQSLSAFERWLGRPSEGVLLHTGFANWDDWSGSIPWLAQRWQTTERTQFWSIPLIPQGASLEDAAAGRYDDRYRKAAEDLSRLARPGPIYVRTGWEFNGDWTVWSAIGREEAYIGAFRKFVEAFRSSGDRFVFEWCPNIGDYGMNPENAYPGDHYVDIIGMDFYYDARWNDPDPLVTWRFMVERPYGLAWHQAFAARHDKPTAYSEWGVGLPNAARYVDAAADWFRSHPVLYQSYWDSDAAFTGKLSSAQFPDVGAAYRRAFGP